MRWNQLAPNVVRTTKPGKHYDGAGLMLDVSPSKIKGHVTRAWLLRYYLGGRERMMGLGSANVVTLAEAREKRDAARKLLAPGIDPIEHRNAEISARRAAESRRRTFGETVAAFLDKHADTWRPAHRAQWKNSVHTHCRPIWSLDVAAIDTPEVLRVVEPIWRKTPISANRLRKRIDEVLAFAVASGFRPAAPSPARWKGHLDAVLPEPRALRPVQHHPALPVDAAPSLYGKLTAAIDAAPDVDSVIPEVCLCLVLLTAVRSVEARGAKRSEIEDRLWMIPPNRMKKRKGHRVPLSTEALALIKRLPKGRDLMFAMNGRDKPITKQTLANALARHAGEGFTTHGLRSTFCQWCDERTNVDQRTKEHALAHVVGSESERAYSRGDALERRARLMAQWASYLATPASAKGGKVVTLQGSRAA